MSLEYRLFDFSFANKSPEDFEEEEDGEERKYFKDDKMFEIEMFAINESGETASITITDYTPFFFIKVGSSWKDKDVKGFMAQIKKDIKPYWHDSIISCELVKKKKLYGFDGGITRNFVEMKFKNTMIMNKIKYLFYDDENKQKLKKGYKYKDVYTRLYEANIPPLLRYFHVENISPSGWVEINKFRETKGNSKRTRCAREFKVKCGDLIPLNNKETQVPYKICSFDIEASSSHGDFPLPAKDYKKLATNIIDFWKTQKNISDLKAKKLIETLVLCAFGYGSNNDIDLVYPKCVRVEKDELSITIKEWIRKRVNTDTNNDKDNSYNNEDVEEELTVFNYNKKNKFLKKEVSVYDIITNSSYEYDDKITILTKSFDKTFPDLEGDKVTFIGSTFWKYGEKEPYLNHCVVLDDCDQLPQEKTQIDTVDSERKLLVAWKDLILKEDPDIIIGYNIFGFDYQFMYERSRQNRCDREFLELSRIKYGDGKICHEEYSQGKFRIAQSKIVLASGEHDLKYINMIGRLQIDLYNYFRRDYNLDSYKLDHVASQFIGDKVSKYEHIGSQTTIFTSNMTGLYVGSFVHFEETSHSTDYYKEGTKFKIITIDKESKSFIIDSIEDFDMNKKVRWGMAKDDVTPQDIFRMTNEGPDQKAIIAKYCIQDCNLVHHLMNKIDVVTGYIEMSKICSVPMNFLVMRGQGIKLTSFIAKKCREKNTLMPVVDKKFNDDGYEGAIVLDPKCNLYLETPVACVDYASLYPSSMISENLSHDSKVWTKEYDLDGNLIYEYGEKDENGEYVFDNMDGYEYVDITYDTFKYIRQRFGGAAVKTLSGKKTCRWAQFPNGQKGIMPSILEELLQARKATRKKIKTESDPFMQNVLDKRQISYKLTANSLYGQCGAKTSTFYEKDVAASTTATGRLLLTYAKKIIEEVYGDTICETKNFGKVRTKAEYIYGDTDSVFFAFHPEDPETGEKIVGKDALEITIELAVEAGALASKYLKGPHDLEYEKTFMPFCLLSKKRYVGMLYENDVNKCEQKSMGIVLKRRDNAPIVKDVYGGIIDILMKEQDIQKAMEFLSKCLGDLKDGKYPLDKLIITKSLRSNYKNPESIAHKVLADRIGKRDPGNKPSSGDRIPFVFFHNKNNPKLQGDKIETPAFMAENNLKPDYSHYITNQIMKPVQQLFALVLEEIPAFTRKPFIVKQYKKKIKAIKEEFGDDRVKMDKKMEDLRNKEVKTILFDSYLKEISNAKNNIQTLDGFFMKK
jgi:DNA polymerase elongation subunit (family B)